MDYSFSCQTIQRNLDDHFYAFTKKAVEADIGLRLLACLIVSGTMDNTGCYMLHSLMGLQYI